MSLIARQKTRPPHSIEILLYIKQTEGMTKYILVTGGVISGLGKGIIASSTGLLLQTLGVNVTAIKIDPYLNIDAGTLSPLDHGEVFVLEDGGEVDLDLGNYERFLNVTLSRDNNITTGKVYKQVIERERRGDYLGKTVQVVPHVTDAIQDWIQRVGEAGARDGVCMIELGGTVGDIESAPFIEALRQFQFRVGHDNFAVIHVSLVPVIDSVGEQKTKPTQASVRELRSAGLLPDVIACRSSVALTPSAKDKIAMFCHVDTSQVFSVHDCSCVYGVPALLESQGLVTYLQKRLQISGTIPNETLWNRWKQLAIPPQLDSPAIRIALVGKYTHLHDAYISVTKALQHAASSLDRYVQVQWIEADHLESCSTSAWDMLRSSHGIIVPGGFGDRGIQGKTLAITWARENKVPFLGLCLGMQLAVMEFARNVCGLDVVHEEFDSGSAIIKHMPEVRKDTLGATMRLGSCIVRFVSPCALRDLYGGAVNVTERHRHRYEMNADYCQRLEADGMRFVAFDPSGTRVEAVELESAAFFVGTQFHPEYTSRVVSPSPPFIGLVEAAAVMAG